MTGTIGAAAKVETKEMKNPIQDMWKDMWCGRWNEKTFKDIALFSLLFFLTSRRGEGEFLDEEKTKKDRRVGVVETGDGERRAVSIDSERELFVEDG